MKISGGTIYALKLPFVESFSHSASKRSYSDSVIVRVYSEDGIIGYGEGVPRQYVTGENVQSCLEHMVEHLWPAIQRFDYPNLIQTGNTLETLSQVVKTLPGHCSNGVIAWNASKSAFEIALIDLLLKRQSLSLGDLLQPKRQEVTYSGVITSGPIEKAAKIAQLCTQHGLQFIKIKIGGNDTRERVAAIREVVGPSVSLRVDANGAYNVREALAMLTAIAPFDIDCVEQPIPRSEPYDLAQVKSHSPIPVMVDESLVTLEDAHALIAAQACDFFNLRISKCGGIYQTIEIAQTAANAGLGLQLGCQVGESAILSAAGRHLAAYITDLAFLEGSFGKRLLVEDVTKENFTFGHEGKARLVEGPGLGVSVCEEFLKDYAVATATFGES